MQQSKFQNFLRAGVVLATVAMLGTACTSKAATTTSTQTSSSTTKTTNVATTDKEVDWDALPTTDLTLSSDETYTISKEGTYILSGTTTKGINITTDGNVRLVLKNAKISSSTTAAIVAEKAKYVVIQTESGTTNTVADGTTHSNDDIKSAIYVQNDLTLTGEGALNVTGTSADGIVAKDKLKILSGTINAKTADDGIKGKDQLDITGGTITVDAKGDGIKSNNKKDQTKGNLTISGGTVTVSSGDDAIKAEEKLTVSGGKINVKTSAEGIEAAVVTFDGGETKIYATDDGVNGSASEFITNPTVTINDGKLTVEVGQGDTDAIDSNGDYLQTGGTVDLTGQMSTIDYDGTAKKTGGTMILNGEETDTIPEGMMGGGRMGGGPGGMQ